MVLPKQKYSLKNGPQNLDCWVFPVIFVEYEKQQIQYFLYQLWEGFIFSRWLHHDWGFLSYITFQLKANFAFGHCWGSYSIQTASA